MPTKKERDMIADAGLAAMNVPHLLIMMGVAGFLVLVLLRGGRR